MQTKGKPWLPENRFLRGNCDCRHPVCTVITSLVHVCMRSLDFLQCCLVKIPFGGRAWGKGKKKRKRKKETNLLAADINCELQTSTKHYLPQSCNNLNNPSSSWWNKVAADVHTVYGRHNNTRVTVTESKVLLQNSGLKSISNYNYRLRRIPPPHLTKIGNINLQKQEMNELKCKTIC